MKNFYQFWVLIGDNLNCYNQCKLRVKIVCQIDVSSQSFISDNFIDLIGKGDVDILIRLRLYNDKLLHPQCGGANWVVLKEIEIPILQTIPYTWLNFDVL